jgi:glycerol kinase
MAVVLSIDAGTTGVRTFAVDSNGALVSWRYQEFPQYFPRPGWVEHDAREIWDAVVATLAAVMADVDQSVAAIGITDQRETTVLWDRRSGEPLHRAIVWQDRRTADRCDELDRAGALPLVRSTTGLVLDPYFSATKVEWLLGDGGVSPSPDLAFGTIDSWLIWKLTGGASHVTDVTNAARTMLFDIRTLEWSPELLDLFGVPASCLPEVRPSSGRLGLTTDGLPCGPGIPVSGSAGDQQAALFGQACFRPGMAKNTYGTGSFVLKNVGETCPEPVDGLLTTVAWTLDVVGGPVTHYALEGAIFATGSAIQWLRDGLGIIGGADETGPLAESCTDTGGVIFVPAFTGLGSPWWDPYARGTIVGITRGTGRAELARAVVEAMAFQTRDVVEAMDGASDTPLADLRADGGASVMDLLLQLQADQLQVDVVRPAMQETTAMGAAYLAGLAEGVWSLRDIEERWAVDRRVSPAVDRVEADEAHATWRRAVERSRGWAHGSDS